MSVHWELEEELRQLEADLEKEIAGLNGIIEELRSEDQDV